MNGYRPPQPPPAGRANGAASDASGIVAPRIASGPWWILYSGPLEPTRGLCNPTHKLIVHAGRPCVGDDDRRVWPGPIVVLEPNQPHHIIEHRDHVLIVHVDPVSVAGVAITTDRRETQPLDLGHPVFQMLGSLRPENWSRAEEAVRRVIGAVADAPGIERISWWHQPLIDTAILLADGSDVIDEAWFADHTGLDATRIADAFANDVGTTCTAYARWIRATAALDRVAEYRTDGDSPTVETPSSPDELDVLQLLRGAAWSRGRPVVLLRP